MNQGWGAVGGEQPHIQRSWWGGRKCQGHKDSFWVCCNWCFNVYVEQLGEKNIPTKPQPAAWPRIGLASFNLSISEAQRLPWSAGIWSPVLGNCYVSNLMFGSWCPSPRLLVKSHPTSSPLLHFVFFPCYKRKQVGMGWSLIAFSSFRNQLACVTTILLKFRGESAFRSRGYNDFWKWWKLRVGKAGSTIYAFVKAYPTVHLRYQHFASIRRALRGGNAGKAYIKEKKKSQSS